LKRCTSTETLWNRKAPSLSSPEDEEIFLPKLPKSYYYYYLLVLRPKAAQHNITITKTEETHKKLKTKIHKN